VNLIPELTLAKLNPTDRTVSRNSTEREVAGAGRTAGAQWLSTRCSRQDVAPLAYGGAKRSRYEADPEAGVLELPQPQAWPGRSFARVVCRFGSRAGSDPHSHLR
jgi:hypothetical protein